MAENFKIEGHTHTAETSKCGRIPAAQLVDMYHSLGYNGLAITDHLHEEYTSLLYCRDDWDTCVDRFLDGYKLAKKRGDELGMSVIFGAELRFQENENDYLIFGIDEAFLRDNPYLFRLGLEGFYNKFHNDVLILQAHPFRENNPFVDPNFIHGAEIVNCHPDHKNYNANALAMCKENPGLYRICGSDAHRRPHVGRSFVLFDQPVNDSYEYKAAVESGCFSLHCFEEEDQAILREAEEYFK